MTATYVSRPQPGAARQPAARAVPWGGAVTAVLEVWRYRDLLVNLVRRDLAVRYRRSALGFLWSFLNPLLMMAVFYIVFMVVKPQQVRNYQLFVLSGLLAWNFMAGAL